MEKEMIIVLDFGGQYNQLIARRVRECNVYAEVHPYTLSLEKIKEMNPKGIIFTGGPNSVYGEDSPRCSKEIFELGIPVLGICYGSQLMAYMLGGKVLRLIQKIRFGNTDPEKTAFVLSFFQFFPCDQPKLTSPDISLIPVMGQYFYISLLRLILQDFHGPAGKDLILDPCSVASVLLAGAAP